MSDFLFCKSQVFFFCMHFEDVSTMGCNTGIKFQTLPYGLSVFSDRLYKFTPNKTTFIFGPSKINFYPGPSLINVLHLVLIFYQMFIYRNRNHT